MGGRANCLSLSLVVVGNSSVQELRWNRGFESRKVGPIKVRRQADGQPGTATWISLTTVRKS